MGTPFFDGVLEYIGKYIRYEALSNYAGNSFFKDSGKLINEHFPLIAEKKEQPHALQSILSGFDLSKIPRFGSREEAMGLPPKEKKQEE